MIDYHAASWLVLGGRLLIVLLFLVTGLFNLTKSGIESHIDQMAALHVPLPAAAFWLGIVLQFTGCALLIASWHAQLGVYCLIVFIVTASAIFHRFWNVPDPMRRKLSRTMLLHNVGILGGLLLLLESVPR